MVHFTTGAAIAVKAILVRHARRSPTCVVLALKARLTSPTAPLCLSLIIIGRLYIDAFIQNIVSLLLIHIEDFFSPLRSVLLIFEGDQYKAETTATLRGTVPHYNCVDYFPKRRKIDVEVFLRGRECQPSHKKLYLVFGCRLVERSSRGHHSVTMRGSRVVHAMHTAHWWKGRKASQCRVDSRQQVARIERRKLGRIRCASLGLLVQIEELLELSNVLGLVPGKVLCLVLGEGLRLGLGDRPEVGHAHNAGEHLRGWLLGRDV
jgi:hypothetical protein